MTQPDADRLAELTAFLDAVGWADADRRLLAGDASFRRYDRLTRGAETVVLMDAPPPLEDVRPFVRVGRHLARLGLSAPRILAADEARGFVLLEDLGDDTYTRLIAAGADEHDLYALAIDTLAALHARPDAARVPEGVPAYDDDLLIAEATLLTDWWMPAAVGADTAPDTRAEFVEIWRRVLPLARRVPDTLVLRDYHVDNLLRLPGRPGVQACGLLDFQDAVCGPLTYDLMSLLEDARRDLGPDLVAAMTARYHDDTPGLEPTAFETSWAILAATRHAKVIGIFTRLFVRDGKPQYLRHIPRVWRHYLRALAHPALGELRTWTDQHIPAHLRGVPGPLRGAITAP